MRLLLDTHTVFWWFTKAASLSEHALALISDPENTVVVSAASAWELAIKATTGKLDSLSIAVDLHRLVQEEAFAALPITFEHAARAGLLPSHHRDPFDRLLVAQAQAFNMPIVSADSVLDRYDIQRIW